MTENKRGFVAQIKSYPATFWVANTMEIFERMAWYGFYAVSSLYITGPKETGGLGFTSVQRGQIQAIVPFFLYMFPVLTGALADRYGYKKMFTIAYVGMIISYYLLGQATSMPGFLAAFMLVAVAAAIFKPVVVGTVARVTDEGNSSTGFGVFYMMVNIGGFCGPLVAGAVRGVSWEHVFLACSGWALVNLIIVSLFYKEPTTEAGSEGARTFRKVMDDAVEVLGNLRFFITVFVVLIALMLPGFRWTWCTWTHIAIFVPIWLVLNAFLDLAMPPGSGRPARGGRVRRNPLLKRMHCSNWRFALFLLIMSGFWTSFNQIFLTMPEYIRDYADTKGMVDFGRKVFGWLNKPDWIDRLAAIEETELLREFDSLVRRARGVDTMEAPEERETQEQRQEARQARAEREKKMSTDPSLTDEDRARLARLVTELNTPGAPEPLQVIDLVDGARTILQYKVRIQPSELGELVAQIPNVAPRIEQQQMNIALRTVNARLRTKGKPELDGDGDDQLRAVLPRLFANSRFPDRQAVAEACASFSGGVRLEPSELALGVRDLAYRAEIWDRMDAGRQVNPEHIVNFDAGAIVLLQVLVSFLMAKFHRFTTMIVGMVVAAVGIGLSAVAGGTMIGPLGGSLLVVIAGIVIFGIGEMMASPTSQEYVARIAPQDKVALYMGYYFVAVALGNLFGGILSGEMYEKLARDMQRPDLLWLFFGGLMLLTAFIFLLYNKFALPKEAASELTGG